MVGDGVDDAAAQNNNIITKNLNRTPAQQVEAGATDGPRADVRQDQIIEANVLV